MANVAAPREGEEILLEERKSFVVKIRQVSIFVVLLVAALILFTVQNTIISGIAFVLLLAALTYGIYHFIIWYYDLYLVTNMRVMIISQKGIFNREFIEVEMSDITDVRYQVRGMLATILHHGTVSVTTNSGQVYELKGVTEPAEVREAIATVVSTLRRHHS